MKALLIATLLLISTWSSAQEPLTFETALTKTLEHNYAIRISKLDRDVASNNAERSANNYLPTVSGSGGYNWTFFKGNNRLITEDRSFDPNNAYNYNAGITLSYSIFDGFGRKYRFEQAQGTRALSDIQLQRTIENAILELSRSYHEVARLQEQTASLKSTFSISKERLQRAEYGLEYGQTVQLDVLNAEVDMDTDSINLLFSQQSFENEMRNLNLVMGMPIATEYLIQEAVELRDDLNSDAVVEASLSNGALVRIARQTQEIADLSVSNARSAWYPQLGVSGGYQYRGSDDPNGAFVVGNSIYGPTAGISLNWNIYDARNKVNVANAKVQAESSAISLEQTEEQVRRDALNAHGAYKNALYVLQARDVSVVTAVRNFERSKESFALGQISSLEFRQAQLNLLNAQLQLSQAMYDAKNFELQVLALMGGLLR
jgi:outer membrane protein